MTLALLVLASQVADALAYVLASEWRIEYRPDAVVAVRMGTEANPLMGALDTPALLAVKIGLALVLTIGSVILVHRGRQRFVAWLAVPGFVGALSGLAVL